MRRIMSTSYVCSVALGLLVALSAIPMSAAQSRASERVFAQSATALDVTTTASYGGAYLAGRIAEIDNDLPVAIAYYRQALQHDPDNVAMQRDLLLAYLTNGQFHEALPFARELKNASEVERFSKLTLAIKAFEDKHFKTARTNLRLTQQSEMDRLASGLMSAWTYVGQGKPKEGLAAASNLDGPVWYDLFRTYTLALIADVSGQKKTADKYYRQALDDKEGGSAAPDTYERIIFSYADYKLRNGDREGALKLLRDAEQVMSGRVILSELRRKVEAGEKLDTGIHNAREGAAEVLYTLGTAINRGGAEAFARLYLQMSLPLRPNHDATVFQLGDIAAKTNQPQQAIKYYGLVAESSPYKRDAEMQLALNLAEIDQADAAIEHLKTLIKGHDGDNRSYLALGGVYAQKEDFANAAEIYDQAVERIEKPERADWPVFYQRGIAYERLKQWDKAEPNFRQALELFPKQPQVMNYLGYSWVDRGENLEEALAMITEAVELRPQDGYIVDSLGWAYYKLGRYDEAVQELEKAVKLRPEDPTINDHLGDAYWQSGRQLEATFQWNHAITSKPEPDELINIQNKLKHGVKTLVRADIPSSTTDE